MGIFEIILGFVAILIAAALTFIILMQEGKGGMGALTGDQTESFGRNAGKTLNTALKSVTKVGVIALMVLIVVVNVVSTL